MSEVAETGLVARPDTARPLPFATRTRDAMLPVVVVLSLIVHATVLIALLFHGKKTSTAAPAEIPVEIIQEPAKAPPPKAPPKPAKPPETAKQAARPDPPKPPQQPQKSPEQAKQAEAQARVAERMRNLLGQPPPSLDAAALPGESANGTEGASYQQLVLSKLTKALGFDRHRGKPGFAVVTFVLDDRGGIASVTLDRPSGDPILDDEAVAVVRRGSPYPPPPPGGKRDYTVTLESRPVF